MWTVARLPKVGALSDMSLVTVNALGAVSKHCEVTAYTLTSSDFDMRIPTVIPSASALVGKVLAERCSFRCWVMREVACVSCVGTLSFEIVPANGDLGGVMLICARLATIAFACKNSSK
jgi:hypothetical protein